MTLDSSSTMTPSCPAAPGLEAGAASRVKPVPCGLTTGKGKGFL